MSNNINDINSYIKDFPETVQVQLQAIRHIISKAVPKAKEVISYGIPTFRQKANLVHYAGYKNHIGFYPGPKAIATFKNDSKEGEQLSFFSDDKNHHCHRLYTDLLFDEPCWVPFAHLLQSQSW